MSESLQDLLAQPADIDMRLAKLQNAGRAEAISGGAPLESFRI